MKNKSLVYVEVTWGRADAPQRQLTLANVSHRNSDAVGPKYTPLTTFN